jgi:hypothetical protein
MSADNKLFRPGPGVVVGGGWTTSAVVRIILGDLNGDGRTDIISQDALGHFHAGIDR